MYVLPKLAEICIYACDCSACPCLLHVHRCVQYARTGVAGLFCGCERAFIDCVLTEGAWKTAVQQRVTASSSSRWQHSWYYTSFSKHSSVSPVGCHLRYLVNCLNLSTWFTLTSLKTSNLYFQWHFTVWGPVNFSFQFRYYIQRFGNIFCDYLRYYCGCLCCLEGGLSELTVCTTITVWQTRISALIVRQWLEET